MGMNLSALAKLFGKGSKSKSGVGAFFQGHTRGYGRPRIGPDGPMRTGSMGRGAVNRGYIDSSMSFIGRYSPGGGALRMGGFGLASGYAGFAADNIEQMSGYDEWSQGRQFMTKAALRGAQYYMGYRGLKSMARGLTGGVQAATNAKYVPEFAKTYGRVRPGPTGYRAVKGNKRARAAAKEHNRVSKNEVRLGKAGRNRITNPRNQHSMLDTFEKYAGMPSRLPRKAGALMGRTSLGAITGPFAAANIMFQGARSTIYHAGRGLKKMVGMQVGPGKMAGPVATMVHGFGNMKHPMAASFAIGGVVGVHSSVANYNAYQKRGGIGAPAMKSPGTRPHNNFSANVVFTAHNRNRGM